MFISYIFLDSVGKEAKSVFLFRLHLALIHLRPLGYRARCRYSAAGDSYPVDVFVSGFKLYRFYLPDKGFIVECELYRQRRRPWCSLCIFTQCFLSFACRAAPSFALFARDGAAAEVLRLYDAQAGVAVRGHFPDIGEVPGGTASVGLPVFGGCPPSQIGLGIAVFAVFCLIRG